ncbi:MAG: hypothetical protein AB7S71_18210 [Dongiaceae bacterium]
MNSSISSEIVAKPVETALARSGLDAGIPASGALPRTTGHPGELAGHPGDDADSRIAARLAQLQRGHPIAAARCVIVDAPGEPTTLVLYTDDGALGSIQLGPADAVRVASDLLLSARRRLGRPFTTEEPIHD